MNGLIIINPFLRNTTFLAAFCTAALYTTFLNGGTHYGLFDGINEYGTFPDVEVTTLNGCVYDATNTMATCIERGEWTAKNSILLTNAAATIFAIRSAITNLAQRAVAGDTVLIFHSGHGMNEKDDPAEYTTQIALVAHDAYYWDYEVAADLSLFTNGVKVVVFVDTCHSGGLFKTNTDTIVYNYRAAAAALSLPSTSALSAADLAGKSFAERVAAYMDTRRAAVSSSRSASATVLSASPASLNTIDPESIGWLTAVDYNQISLDDVDGGKFASGCVVNRGWRDGIADLAPYGNADGYVDFNEFYRYATAWFSTSKFIGQQTPQAFHTNVLASVRAGTAGTPTTFDIAFSLNDGIHSSFTRTYTNGLPYGTLPATARDGYLFMGWWSKAEDQQNADTFALDSITELQAKWGLPLNEALDNAALEFTTAGNTAWYGTDIPDGPSASAAQTGTFSDAGQISTLSTTLTRTDAGQVTFYWRVNSATNENPLIFLVNDSEVARISGDQDWSQFSYSFPSGGVYTLTWTMSTTSSALNGDDVGQVDRIAVTAVPGDPVAIRFEGNGGTPSAASLDYPAHLVYGTLPTATRCGFAFAGWYTAAEGGALVSVTNVVTAAATLYAHWAAPAANTHYGLFIGVNIYDLRAASAANTLYGCETDARNMRGLCISRGEWLPENTTMLLDDAATISAIRSAITNLAQKAVAGDTVLITHSSHGASKEDADGNDTTTCCICTYDDTEYWDYLMADDLSLFKSGVRVVIQIDTCHSGGMFKTNHEYTASAAASASFQAAAASASFRTAAASASTFAERVSAYMQARRSAASATRGAASLRSLAPEGITADEIGWRTAVDYDQSALDFNSLGGLLTSVCIANHAWRKGLADTAPFGNGDGYVDFYEFYQYATNFYPSVSTERMMPQVLNTEVLASVRAGTIEAPISTTVAFDANGGTVALAGASFISAATYGTLPSATWGDYTFNGWWTKPVGGNRLTELSAISDIAPVLYAHWTVPLQDSLDTTALTFETAGNSAWFGQPTVAHNGGTAAQSGALGCAQTNWISATVTGPGVVSFYWKVSCKPTFYESGSESSAALDFLSFFVDDVPIKRISGIGADWAKVTYAVTSAVNTATTLKWEFSRDENDGCALSGGWVDQVVWTPGSATTLSPAPVDYAWLVRHGLVTNDDFEAAATNVYANGRPGWESFVAGLVPTNPVSEFLAEITYTNGASLVTWTPDLGKDRHYIVEGKTNLVDGSAWSATNAATRFYRVRVALP